MERNLFCPTCQKHVTTHSSSNGQVPCPVCGAMIATSRPPDVFISHATEDRLIVEKLVAALDAAGIDHWLARRDIGGGDSWPSAIDEALAQAKVIVLILSSAAVKSKWVPNEILTAYDTNRTILPLRIEEFENAGRLALPLKGIHEVACFQRPFETYLDDVIGRIRELLALPAADPPLALTPVPKPLKGVVRSDDPADNPYIGPEEFPRQTTKKFSGREEEAKQLLEKIANHRVVLLYAPSGAGKSSLLNTSIYNELEGQGYEVITGARVGGALPGNLKPEEVRNIYTFAAIYNSNRKDESIPRRPKLRLADYLRDRAPRRGTRRRIMVLDQFEEMFTRHGHRYKDREEFFQDLIVALNDDPKLSVLLAMRKEYLADILPKADKLPKHLPMATFPLDPLGRVGALNAVTMPIAEYATFDPAVVGDIVDQLRTIYVKGPDDVELPKQGEFVDMVELQIVCQQLWNKLPEGTKYINNEVVSKALGEGRSVSDFATNALNDFYERTILEVSESKPETEGGYSLELIRRGCMRFVTVSSTRKLVQRNSDGRTGLLPDWIIDQLEHKHLLRSEEHGTDRWYELAHDRLAEPISRQKDGKLGALLHAEEMLAKTLEQALLEHGQKLDGYFSEHSDILRDCKAFRGEPGFISIKEAEFIFRSSLVTGVKEEMVAWSERLAVDHPQLREQVLRDALETASQSHPSDAEYTALLGRVRRNAARLIGLQGTAMLSRELLRLALSDADPLVRRAAAVSLARLDKPDLYAEIIAKLHDAATAKDAKATLANIRVAVDQKLAVEEKLKDSKDRKAPAPRFESCFSRLGWETRTRILLEAWGNRFAAGPSLFLFIAIPAAVFAAISAAAFKWLPGKYGWSLEQKAASSGMGIFHGLSGGVVWGGSIALGLALFYIVVERQQDKKSSWRPFGAIVTGAVFGLISSALIVLVIVWVFEMDSLVGMGWITDPDPKTRFGKEFWQQLFVKIGYGWVQLFIGTGMGIGMALATNRLRAWDRWNGFLRRQSSVTGWKQSARMILDIMPIAARRLWPVPLIVIFAAVVASFVPTPPKQPDIPPLEAISAIRMNTETLLTNPKEEKAINDISKQLETLKVDHTHDRPGFWSKDRKAANNTPDARRMQLIHGLIADCLSQMLGAYFAIVGMGFGMVIVTHGVQIAPWKN